MNHNHTVRSRLCWISKCVGGHYVVLLCWLSGSVIVDLQLVHDLNRICSTFVLIRLHYRWFFALNHVKEFSVQGIYPSHGFSLIFPLQLPISCSPYFVHHCPTLTSFLKSKHNPQKIQIRVCPLLWMNPKSIQYLSLRPQLWISFGIGDQNFQVMTNWADHVWSLSNTA